MKQVQFNMNQMIQSVLICGYDNREKVVIILTTTNKDNKLAVTSKAPHLASHESGFLIKEDLLKSSE